MIANITVKNFNNVYMSSKGKVFKLKSFAATIYVIGNTLLQPNIERHEKLYVLR